MDISKLKDSHSIALGNTYATYARLHSDYLGLENTIVAALIGDEVFNVEGIKYDPFHQTVVIAYEDGVDPIKVAQEIIRLSVSRMSLSDVLNLPMSPDRNDPQAISVLDYLIKLLRTVWKQGEDFSGKRPWGNGGWKYDLAEVLIENNVISGELDDDGCVSKIHWEECNKLINELIDEIYRTCKK